MFHYSNMSSHFRTLWTTFWTIFKKKILERLTVSKEFFQSLVSWRFINPYILASKVFFNEPSRASFYFLVFYCKCVRIRVHNLTIERTHIARALAFSLKLVHCKFSIFLRNYLWLLIRQAVDFYRWGTAGCTLILPARQTLQRHEGHCRKVCWVPVSDFKRRI